MLDSSQSETFGRMRPLAIQFFTRCCKERHTVCKRLLDIVLAKIGYSVTYRSTRLLKSLHATTMSSSASACQGILCCVVYKLVEQISDMFVVKIFIKYWLFQLNIITYAALLIINYCCRHDGQGVMLERELWTSMIYVWRFDGTDGCVIIL
jgi:hypothetical protein